MPIGQFEVVCAPAEDRPIEWGSPCDDVSVTPGERKAALEWLGQLQQRGADASIFERLPPMSETLEWIDRNREDILNEFGKVYGTAMLGRPGAARVPSDPTAFPVDLMYEVVADICEGLNEQIKPVNGSKLVPPVIGIVQGPGLSPIHSRVPFSSAQVITVPLQLMLYSNLVARSLAQILNPRRSKTQRGWYTCSIDPGTIDFQQPRRRAAIDHLGLIVASQVIFGEAFAAPLPRLGARHEPFRSWLREAMETFAVAHEYGHFVADHHAEAAPEICEFSKRAELEADAIGQRLTIGASVRSKNPVGLENGGAVVLFWCLEYVQRSTALLKSGRWAESQSATHPKLDERLDGLASFLHPAPAEKQMLWRRLLERIWRDLEEGMLKLHLAGVRPFDPDAVD